jgi:Sec-independent protein translocase protein TatA
MTNIEYPYDQGRIKQIVRWIRRFKKEKEKYEEEQEEENKRT